MGCVNGFDVKPAASEVEMCSRGRNNQKNLTNDGVDFRCQNSSGSGNKKVIICFGSWTPKVGQ